MIYRSIGGMPATLTVKGQNGEVIEVKRLEAWESCKIVGVYQAANGNMSAQMEVISEKIDDMGNKIRDNWVPRRLAWQGLRSMMWPSFAYPLPACTFSESKADRLTTDLYKLILPTMGMTSSFPRVYRHSPKRFQGVALTEFRSSSEAEKIARLLQHGDTPSLAGQLQNVSLEQAQLEVGIQTPILEASFETYGFLLTDCWFTGLWRFASKEDIVLKKEDPVILPLQREGDEFIMEKLIRLCDWGNSDIIKFNRCRIKMQALTMADIIHGDGITLRDRMKSYMPTEVPGSKYEWARENPSAADWAIWRRGLLLLTSSSETLPFFDKLGKWLTTPHKQWEWYYSPSRNVLFRLFRGATHEYHPLSSTRRGYSPADWCTANPFHRTHATHRSGRTTPCYDIRPYSKLRSELDPPSQQHGGQERCIGNYYLRRPSAGGL